MAAAAFHFHFFFLLFCIFVCVRSSWCRIFQNKGTPVTRELYWITDASNYLASHIWVWCTEYYLDFHKGLFWILVWCYLWIPVEINSTATNILLSSKCSIEFHKLYMCAEAVKIWLVQCLCESWNETCFSVRNLNYCMIIFEVGITLRDTMFM